MRRMSLTNVDRIHQLNIQEQYLLELVQGIKTWELREDRGRDFRVGDVLRFEHQPTGVLYDFRVSYVFLGGLYGLAPGYVIMSLEREFRMIRKEDA